MGSILNGIRIALRAISRNRLRASLTVLGILVGIASVVTVTALSNGVRDDISGKIEGLGSNVIVVFPESASVSGARVATGKRLSEDDAKAIKNEIETIAEIAPYLQTQAQIVNADENTITAAGGSTLAYFHVANWKIARGSTWSEDDERTMAKRVVIGATVAKKLFGNEDPVGRTIHIDRYAFTIVGVTVPKGQDLFGQDQDDGIIMPISTLRSHLLRAPPGFAGILLASATSLDASDHTVKRMESLLRQRHHIEKDLKSDFGIQTQKQLEDLQGQIFIVLSSMLVSIAGISLIVGGIGVMNVMLVSVAERTREIGIRMAIGAREHDIRTQFLVEAIVLSVLGGLSGAVFGIASIYGLQAAIGWPMHLSPVALAISVVASGITGITFGFFPARRASRLDPIIALHHE